jgi:hypothetical protein
MEGIMDTTLWLNFVILPNGHVVRCPTPKAARNVAYNFYPTLSAVETRGEHGTLTITLSNRKWRA